MARFRDAYGQLTPEHMLVNTQGPGKATFEVYWTTDPTYQTAELRVRRESMPDIMHSWKFENWRVDTDAQQVTRYVEPLRFAEDAWEVALRDQ